jgi:hypothetical protein
MAETRKMVTALFRDRVHAENAFDRLHSLGYTDNDINVLMSDRTRSTYYSEDHGKMTASTKATEGMGVGGVIGTAVGASLAAIAAVGTSLVVPGLGLVVAGPIAAALAGAGAGAVTGGIVGALVGWGIPESNARAYEEALRDGAIVIGVVPHTSADVSKLEKEFKEMQGENVFVCSC